MTLQELVTAAGRSPVAFVVAFALLPCVAWLIGELHPRGRGSRAPWSIAYLLVLYAATAPGILSATLLADAAFSGRDLHELDPLVTWAPIVSMLATLLVASRSVSMAALPGFGRVVLVAAGLAVSFIAALAIERSVLWVGLDAPVAALLAVAALVYVVLRGSAWLLFRRRAPARLAGPRYPGF